MTVIDVVQETMRLGGFLHDAAARVGVAVETLRTWRTMGNRCLAEITQGKRRRSEMNRHERNCATLAAKMDLAEAEARTSLMALVNKVAHGEYKRKETTTETDAAGAVIKNVTREIDVGPDSHMISWWLQHRWPADFNRSRLEITGADGGAVQVDATPIVDKVRRHLADIQAARAESDPAAMEAMVSGAGEAVAGNGNGHHP